MKFKLSNSVILHMSEIPHISSYSDIAKYKGDPL